MRLSLFTKILCISCLTYYAALAVETRMAYSDLIPLDLQEFLYNDAVSLDKDVNADIINLSAHRLGSLPIVEDFLSDQLELCILALPEDNEFPALENDRIVKIPFGYKSSVVVVNAENPISEITIDELASIFGDSNSTANLLSWRDFGMSSFSTSSIKAYAVKEDMGISADLFRYTVLSEESISPAVSFDEEDSVQRMIFQDKSAIGVFPTNPENENLKVLFVAQDEESIAYGPSIDNIYYSDYPIRLPFYIVYNIDDSKLLYPLITSLLSDAVADIIRENDFYPIPKVIREKLIIDLQLYLQENEY